MAAKHVRRGEIWAWVWFPLALLGLLLLALPGIVLFLLYVFEYGAETNSWLQDNLNLSFHPHLPTWQWVTDWRTFKFEPTFILLLLPFLIILLYFLKLKRKPLQVPSTFLWKKSIEDLHVNSLFQWLRRNILLLLQVLIALVLFYAVLGIRVYGNITTGRHYILMIDNSASMATKDADGQSRLAWAKQQALNTIETASANDFGMVIVFNSKASTLQTYTNDKDRLRQAINDIPQTQRPTRIDEALRLADSLANPRESTEDIAVRPEDEIPGKQRTYVEDEGVATDVYLLSDGRFPDLSQSALEKLGARQKGNTSALGKMRLHFRSAGRQGADTVNNLGIVAFNAVRLTDKEGKIRDPNQLQLKVLVRVQNFRSKPMHNLAVHLDVLINDRLEHPLSANVNLPARVVTQKKVDAQVIVEEKPGEREEPITFTLPPLNLGQNPVLRVKLANVEDDFALDNTAWLAFGRPRKARVLIVSPNNIVLKAFFEQAATQKVAKVDWLVPPEMDSDKYRKPARSGTVDMVIFDRCAPDTPEQMPQSNTFFIGTPPPPWVTGTKTLKNPILMVSKRNHPLLHRLTTLWDLRVESAWAFDREKNLAAKFRDNYTTTPGVAKKKLLPRETRLIEASGNVPVIFTLPRGPYSDLVMAFPLLNDKNDLVTNWPLQPSFPLFLRNVLYTLGNVNDTVKAESVQPGQPLILRPEAGVRTLTITTPTGTRQQLERSNHPYFLFSDTEQVGMYNVQHDNDNPQRFTVNLLDDTESNLEPRQAIDIGEETIVAGQTREVPFDISKFIIVGAVALLVLEWFIYNRRVYV